MLKQTHKNWKFVTVALLLSCFGISGCDDGDDQFRNRMQVAGVYNVRFTLANGRATSVTANIPTQPVIKYYTMTLGQPGGRDVMGTIDEIYFSVPNAYKAIGDGGGKIRQGLRLITRLFSGVNWVAKPSIPVVGAVDFEREMITFQPFEIDVFNNLSASLVDFMEGCLVDERGNRVADTIIGFPYNGGVTCDPNGAYIAAAGGGTQLGWYAHKDLGRLAEMSLP